MVLAPCARLWRMRDSWILSSFDEGALAVARDVAPQVPRALIVKTIPADWRVRAGRLGCVALHADQRGLDATTIAGVAEHMTLRAYTVNTSDRAEALFAWGALAVFTDCPDMLISSVAYQTGGPAAAGARGSYQK